MATFQQKQIRIKQLTRIIKNHIFLSATQLRGQEGSFPNSSIEKHVDYHTKTESWTPWEIRQIKDAVIKNCQEHRNKCFPPQIPLFGE